ncbi:MAG: Replicative DNA helicase [Spirochaetes bacterium ADurb.Bin110]|nr:MAG: Replicative DNA helicase [Spirochaetes bacterium ADurb.Bin110]
MRDLLDIEQALLGQILACPNLIDKLVIVPELFDNSDLRAIFTTIEVIRAKCLHVDLVSVGDELSRQGRSDLVVVAANLEVIGSTANAPFYAEQLRERLRRNGITCALREGLDALRDENKSAAELWDNITASGTSAVCLAFEPSIPTISNVLLDYLIDLKNRVKQNRRGLSDSISLGIFELDALLGPIRGGELVVVAGRPGCGKTALVLQTAIHVAVDLKKPTAFFSLEMRREEVLDRLLAFEGVAQVGQIRGGYLLDEQLSDAMSRTETLSQAPLSIYDGSTNIELLRSRIRREKAVGGLSLVVVDYLGLLDMGSGGKTPRWERVGEITRVLKLLAIELNVTILLAVQLNREGDGIIPTLGMLRDSGSIEQDADRVLLLHPCENKDSNVDRQITAILAKNRHGRTGKVELRFCGHHIRFYGGETA